MKKRILSGLLAVIMLLSLCVPALAAEEPSAAVSSPPEPDSRILVAYFSATNTTRPLAEYAAEILGADLYEIVPMQPYTPEDLAYYTGGRADREQNDPAARPAIAGRVEDMAQYDAVLIGYPIWHGQAPRIISTFLESYDFSGKTILPFCTSHSSDIGTSDDTLHVLAPNASWLDGKRFPAGTTREALAAWLDMSGIKEQEPDTTPGTAPALTPVPAADPTPDPTETPEPTPAKDGWVTENGGTYYYQDGKALTGWKQLGGAWYCFEKSGVMVHNEWRADGNTWNYLGPDGKMVTGLYHVQDGKPDDGWYYLDPTHNGTYGTMLVGWRQVGGEWYFFNDKHNGLYGQMVTDDWREDHGTWCFLDSDGKMLVGHQRIDKGRFDDGWYYFNPKHDGDYGNVMSGWITIDGGQYYFNPKHDGLYGKGFVDGTYTINGKEYTFDETGKLTSDAPAGPETGGLPQLDAQAASDLMYKIIPGFMKYDSGFNDTVSGSLAVDFLVSYLGRAEEAEHAFSSSPYTSYAYSKGILTNADSGKTGNAPITVADYITWLLRAMGYVSGSDFDSASPLARADRLGITNGLYAGTEKLSIRWADLLYTAKNALTAPCKAGGTLWQAICTDRILYVNNFNSWPRNITIYNPTGGTITMIEEVLLDMREDGTVVAEFHFQGDDLQDLLAHNPDLGSIPAGGAGRMADSQPALDGMDRMRFEFKYRTADGGTYVQTNTFLLDHAPFSPSGPDYSGDSRKNLESLRHDADFELQVAPGVYWVPTSSLGESRYTNDQIAEMLTLSPAEKQAKIGTLYEALQLYKISDFYFTDDNIFHIENGLEWERHKPGYHAVRTNTGCCVTDSDWLRYILDGDYDEVGFLSIARLNDIGHVFNYILQDGWYYFIDLSCLYQGADLAAPETGRMDDFNRSYGSCGNLMRTRDLQAYVNYVKPRFLGGSSGLMALHSAENWPSTTGIHRDGKLYIAYANEPSAKVQNIYDTPGDELEFTFVTPPSYEPDWAALPSFDFSAAKAAFLQ